MGLEIVHPGGSGLRWVRRGGRQGASKGPAREEADATIAGKWGPIIWPASVVTLSDQTAIAASVVLRGSADALEPRLAFRGHPGQPARTLDERFLEDPLLCHLDPGERAGPPGVSSWRS